MVYNIIKGLSSNHMLNDHISSKSLTIYWSFDFSLNLKKPYHINHSFQSKEITYLPNDFHYNEKGCNYIIAKPLNFWKITHNFTELQIHQIRRLPLLNQTVKLRSNQTGWESRFGPWTSKMAMGPDPNPFSLALPDIPTQSIYRKKKKKGEDTQITSTWCVALVNDCGGDDWRWCGCRIPTVLF